MKISIQDNPVDPGQKRIILHTGQRLSFANFLDHAEASTTLTRSDCLAVFNCASEWIKSAAARGLEADLGTLGRSRLGMKGKFTQIPERIQDSDIKMTISWILPNDLKQFTAKAGADLVRQRTEPADKAPSPKEARRILPDAKPDEIPNRYAPGGPLTIFGNRLNYDVGQPDEGIFIIADDGEQMRIEQVISIMPKQIMCLIPADAHGSYQLQVRRRHKPITGKLLVCTMSQPIVEAE